MSRPERSTAYLVRHAKAGSRDSWTEADELRPLTRKGRRQAEGLVRLLHDAGIGRIVSSPHLRCVQTVRPLALDRQLPLELSEDLSEGAPIEQAMKLLEDTGDTPTVLCSHGDVIPALVLALAERGMAIEGDRDWRKGSIWVLERRDGRFVRGTYVAPPTER